MPRPPQSEVLPGHPDHLVLAPIAQTLRRRFGGETDSALAEIALNALEFVLDPVRTGRTSIRELDNVEKTFVGLKVEHFVRDLLDAPKGLRDLVIEGVDVDVKHTLSESWSWMIPPETIRDQGACLLIASNERSRKSWMGLILARPHYLSAPNRDGKCGIRSSAYAHILWLAADVSWPRDRWEGIDMARFRELRKWRVAGGKRAATFFAENLGKPIHRSVVLALLHDQLDPMKRLRGNNGAKDYLRPEGIALLSGTYFNGVLERLGLPRIDKDEHIAVRPETPSQLEILRGKGELP